MIRDNQNHAEPWPWRNGSMSAVEPQHKSCMLTSLGAQSADQTVWHNQNKWRYFWFEIAIILALISCNITPAKTRWLRFKVNFLRSRFNCQCYLASVRMCQWCHHICTYLVLHPHTHTQTLINFLLLSSHWLMIRECNLCTFHHCN